MFGSTVYSRQPAGLALVWRRNDDMKKGLCIIMILLVVLASPLFADKTFTTDVNMSVSGYLLHGFLDPSSDTLRDTTAVDNALGKDGVDLYYTIRTNQPAGMLVYAEITPFQRQTDEASGQVTIAIASVTVNGKEIAPTSASEIGAEGQSSVVTNGTLVTATKSVYPLIDFDSVYGTTEYTYVIHITADQQQVAEAPPGQYLSSVTMSLTYKD